MKDESEPPPNDNTKEHSASPNKKEWPLEISHLILKAVRIAVDTSAELA